MSLQLREQIKPRTTPISGKLEGKVAVVTGGSAGIGLGIAKEFANEGALVYVTGRRQDALNKAAAEIGDGAIGVQATLTTCTRP